MLENTNLLMGILVLALVFTSAYFSLAETALGACSRAKIHQLAREGNKRAISCEELLKKSEDALSTILLCNNAINILASAIATSVLIKMFGEAGVIYATIVMTILVLVFGEIAPKTYALSHAERIILFSAPLILFLIKIFNPLTRHIQNVIDKTFEIFGSKKHHDSQARLISDLEEIRGTIELKHKAGSIVKYDKDMLDSILDLEDTEISNIMIHRKNVDSIDIEQDLNVILDKALKINHSRIPLWKDDEDNVVAVLNMRKFIAILHHNGGDLSKVNLKQITSEPWFVPATNNLRNQLIAFKQKKEKFALVIDEYGSLMGVVTLEDILEEIVGDIDEKDKNEIRLKISKFKDGAYRIPGELPIRDINRKLNWDLPEDDENAATLAGLLIARAEKIPTEKEKFEFDGFRFEVLRVARNKIISLKVLKINN